MQRVKSPESAQFFLNLQTAVYNSFYLQRPLLNRTTFKRYRTVALNEWTAAAAAAYFLRKQGSCISTKLT